MSVFMRRSLRIDAVVGMTGIFVVIGMCAIFFVSDLVFKEMGLVERTIAKSDARQAVSLLYYDVDKIDSLVKDWAIWDDSYAFMVSRSEAYIASTVTPSVFRDQHLDAIVFVKSDGTLHFGAALNPISEAIVLPERKLLDLLRTRTASMTFQDNVDGITEFVMVGNMLWMVACKPILPSSGVGKANGWLWMGRIIDAEYILDLGMRSALDIGIVPAVPERLPKELHSLVTAEEGGEPVVAAEGNVIWSGVLLPDGVGVMPVALTVRGARYLYAVALDIFSTSLVVMGVFSVVGVLAALIFLDARVLRRLARLSLRVQKQAPDAVMSISPTQGDELDRLGSLFDDAFRAASDNARFLADIMQSLRVGVMLVDRETREIVSINDHACKLMGRTEDEVLGKLCHEFVCASEHGQCPICDLGQSVDHSKRTLLGVGGKRTDILKSVVSIVRNGRQYLLETFVDISEQERARRQLEISEEQYRAIFMNTGTPAILMQQDTSIVLANPEFMKLAGVDAAALAARPKALSFFHEQDVAHMADLHARRWRGEDVPRDYEARFVDTNGNVRDVVMTVSLIPHARQSVAFLLDVTGRKAAEARLKELAYTDSLTGLPSRISGLEQLDAALQAHSLSGDGFGVFLLDLDDFKVVNDSLGHSAGDMALRMVAYRLREAVLPADVLARLGGDEFIVVARRGNERKAYEDLATRLISVLQTPLRVGSSEVFLSVSVGVAIAPDDGDTPIQLVRCADLAMYNAKRAGKNTFGFYTHDLSVQVQQRLAIESDLRAGMASGQIVPYYQPVVDLETGRIVGAEALARWRKPDGEIVPPSVFIPVAEECGLIAGIDIAVLSAACAQVQAWSEAGLGFLRISSNVSARHLVRGNLVGEIRSILAVSRLPASQLALELTETIYVDNLTHAREVLDGISSLGVATVLDDFGTGYSSLAYLQSLSFDTLKIDRSFVQNIPDSSSISLVRAMLSIAVSLGIRSLAEGIETHEQFLQLRSLGCQFGQGYLFAKPLPADAFADLLHQQQQGARLPH